MYILNKIVDKEHPLFKPVLTITHFDRNLLTRTQDDTLLYSDFTAKGIQVDIPNLAILRETSVYSLTPC